MKKSIKTPHLNEMKMSLLVNKKYLIINLVFPDVEKKDSSDDWGWEKKHNIKRTYIEQALVSKHFWGFTLYDTPEKAFEEISGATPRPYVKLLVAIINVEATNDDNGQSVSQPTLIGYFKESTGIQFFDERQIPILLNQPIALMQSSASAMCPALLKPM